MSHYITIDDLTALIPAGWVVEALDDNSDGTQEQFDAVRDAAEGAVNAELEGQYDLPIETPADYPLLKRITALEAARLCYARRGFTDAAFPHQKQHDRTWAKLVKIGEGALPLGPGAGSNKQLAKPRGSIITGKARTYSSTGAFTA